MLVCVSDSSPLVKPEISNITNATVSERENATVTFTVQAKPPVTAASDIAVTFGGNSVDFTVSINGNSVTITLPDLMENSNGDYLVTVNNTAGQDYEIFNVAVYCKFNIQSSVKITIDDCIVAPRFSEQNGSALTVLAGTTVTLNCNIQASNPPATVSASNNAAIKTNIAFMEGANARIVITNTVIGNSGTYICTANNGLQQTVLQHFLTVQGKSIENLSAIVYLLK